MFKLEPINIKTERFMKVNGKEDLDMEWEL